MIQSHVRMQNQNNLKLVLDESLKMGIVLSAPNKIRILCINNFILNFIEIIKSYVSIENSNHIETFAAYIVKYFITKYERKGKFCHAFSTHIHSWKKYLQSSLEARLFLSFLDEMENKHYLKMFLKIRKEITKVNSLALLDEINLSHQQTLTIIHRIYDQQKKKFITKKLNQLYINLNYKLINSLRLQACVFTQFLLSCMSKLQSLDQQVKITQETRRVETESFNSKIDSNNGFITPKKNKQNSNHSKNRITFTTHNEYINKKIVESRMEHFSNAENKSNIHVEDSDRYSSEMIKKYFGESSRFKNFEKSPGRLFKNAEKQLNTLTQIDKILDSRREAVSPSPDSISSKKSKKSKKQENHADLQQKHENQKHQKYQKQQKLSQNWQKMLKMNEDFKNKILKKTKEELLLVNRSSNYGNNLTHPHFFTETEDYSKQVDFSFQDEKQNIPEIRESIINMHKF